MSRLAQAAKAFSADDADDLDDLLGGCIRTGPPPVPGVVSTTVPGAVTTPVAEFWAIQSTTVVKSLSGRVVASLSCPKGPPSCLTNRLLLSCATHPCLPLVA